MRTFRSVIFFLLPLLVLADAVREWRVPLSEAGQSGICLHEDQLYLTIHSLPDGDLSGGTMRASDIVGQCFDAETGALKWSVNLPGSNPGTVLESWHDSTSLTPVADDGRVVFHNLNGRLLACDHDGKILWQRAYAAPEPDIKQARMFIDGERLIVALPSAEIAVPPGGMVSSRKKNLRALPFYQIHALDLASGETIWASPVLQSHATQYSIDGRRIITSLTDLTHWKFKRGRKGHILSLDNGKPLQSFDIPACIPHQKRQLLDGLFLVATNKNLQFVDPLSGSIRKTLPYPQSIAEFANRSLKGRQYPTHSTLHAVAGRIFYWSANRPAIVCIDGEGTTRAVDVPVADHGGLPIWDVAKLHGVGPVANSAGRVVLNRGASTLRGPQWGGFGHVNPAYPVQAGNFLYWQGGLGMLYRIDLRGEFGEERVSWAPISDVLGSWCFGEPAVAGESVYLRSQRELVRLRWTP